MSKIDISEIKEAVKQILKNKKITYKELGERIKMSEPGIKRLMGAKDISLTRLIQICDALQIQLKDLLEETHENKNVMYEIDDNMIKQFQKNYDLFLFFCKLVIEKKSLHAIRMENKLEKSKTTQYLLQLDRMKLIEYGPKEKVKINIPDNFTFETNEFIRKFRKDSALYLVEQFDKKWKSDLVKFQLSSLHLKDETYTELLLSIDAIVAEFGKRSRREIRANNIEDLTNYSLLIGTGPFGISPSI